MRNSIPKAMGRLFWATITQSIESDVPRLGAALAYYTLFAIAPLFVIALAVGGWWFGEEAASKQLFGEMSSLLGKQGAEAVQAIVEAANKPKAGTIATILAFTTLFIGAAGTFVELQDALNTVWNIKPRPNGGFRTFIRRRLLSFAMILGVGFLLLVSLVFSAVLAALGKFMNGLAPGDHVFWSGVNTLVSLGLITVLFAMIFKYLPDAKIAWRDVWLGGLVTATFFNLGKFVLGFYLGRSTMASAYGAAGSLVILLVWVYYSAQILFFGAKFTQLFANEYGSHVKPKTGATMAGEKPSRKHSHNHDD